MSISTLTTKYQLTLPKVIREFLELEVGNKIEFIIRDNREVVLQARKTGLDDIYGMVKSSKRLTVAEMNRAIASYHRKKRSK